MNEAQATALTVLGHAATGALLGAVYSVTQGLQGGTTDWRVLLGGAAIGASLAFLKALADYLEGLQKAPRTTGAKAGKPTKKAPGKTTRAFFGV